MSRIRIIPVLLIQNGGLVKSIKFKNHKYIGDPINVVKIFNEKEVDEIIILDISASKENKEPNLEKISEITSEAFMPLAYGGGITTIQQIQNILYNGAEKVVLNTSALNNSSLITNAAKQFGSQSIVVSIDVKKDWLGRYKVYKNCGTQKTTKELVSYAKELETSGAGEIFLTSIDRDGTFLGYDLELIRMVSESVKIPVVACGGASDISDFQKAIEIGGASAIAAGSMFVYQRPHYAVLISYPTENALLFDSK